MNREEAPIGQEKWTDSRNEIKGGFISSSQRGNGIEDSSALWCQRCFIISLAGRIFGWRENSSGREKGVQSGLGKSSIAEGYRRARSSDRRADYCQPDTKKNSGRLALTPAFRTGVSNELNEHRSLRPRLTKVLRQLGVPSSLWYYRPKPKSKSGSPIKVPVKIPLEVVNAVLKMAEENPWYGYKRIAVMCRRTEVNVTNRQAYRVMRKNGLLQKRLKAKPAELHQMQKLYELLPMRPNELWQTDVTYIHIPGYGWWYAVTVIDYYSRYLLACRLTWSYCATEAMAALDEAKAEAERLTGPLKKPPFLVTDNGSSFIAKRFRNHVSGDFSHVRIQYRTPTQLGLLERFHRTLKQDEVYWREYDNPGHARECLEEFRQRYNWKRPHWALVPDEGGDPLTPEEVYVRGYKTQIPRWQGWAKGAKKKLDQLLNEAS